MLKPMPTLPDTITIGELATRSGIAASALRFYESAGLLKAGRNSGGQRCYERSVLRRVAFIRAAQRVGLPLADVRKSLELLPSNRTPTKAEWEKVSRHWRGRLTARIEELEQLRDQLTSCIGCGCLSLRTCKLTNPQDVAARSGAGAQYLIGGVN